MYFENSFRTNHLTNSNKNRRKQSRVKVIRRCDYIRKWSLISFSQFPQYFLPDPVCPLQTIVSQIESKSNIELPPITIMNEIDSNNKLSSINSNKQTKRSHVGLKKSFQRSRILCFNQFNSWLQCHRHQPASTPRRKSTTETKILTPCLTPKFLNSLHFTRLHQRIFKYQASSSPQIERTTKPAVTLDDSDNLSQSEPPVRIYFPSLRTAPLSRREYIIHVDKLTLDTDNQNI